MIIVFSISNQIITQIYFDSILNLYLINTNTFLIKMITF